VRDHRAVEDQILSRVCQRPVEASTDWLESEVVGALVGALVAGIAGVLAARSSIGYERRLVACSAMQALADEARFNAHVMQQMAGTGSEAASSALERQAFDAALPLLDVLSPELRDRARVPRSRILILMHLEKIVEESSQRGTVPATMTKRRQELIEALPKELNDLAHDVEAFVKTDCTASVKRLFRRRGG
jgi:hypothetical protein